MIVVLANGCCMAVLRQRTAGLCAANLVDGRVPKFCVAKPDVLWAGGRPDRNDAGWLMEQGIRTVVDLEIFHQDRNAFAHARLHSPNAYQVRYFHVLDWEPLPLIAPSIEDSRVARVLAIVSAEPKPVFIHCRCGMKRAALIVAAYEVLFEGVTPESAIHQMNRYGPAWSGPDSRYIIRLSKHREEMKRRIAELVPTLEPEAVVTCSNERCSVTSSAARLAAEGR